MQFQSDGQALRRNDLVQRLQPAPVGLVARVLGGEVDQGVALLHAIDEVLAQCAGGLAARGGAKGDAGK
ncbi:hypothetical protein D3C87_1494390 [compost metagenome]